MKKILALFLAITGIIFLDTRLNADCGKCNCINKFVRIIGQCVKKDGAMRTVNQDQLLQGLSRGCNGTVSFKAVPKCSCGHRAPDHTMDVDELPCDLITYQIPSKTSCSDLGINE